jgi:Phage integrase, N-terminal SAM-like domain
MTTDEAIAEISHLRKRWPAECCIAADPQEERKTMAVPEPRSRPRKQLDAGVLQPEIGSFRLHLAADGKAAKTIRNYAEAIQWFAAACLRRHTLRTSWEQVDRQDVERWMVHLLGRYSQAYTSNQYRALQQFFKWWAAEEELPDPMARLRPPKVTDKLVPVYRAVASMSAPVGLTPHVTRLGTCGRGGRSSVGLRPTRHRRSWPRIQSIPWTSRQYARPSWPPRWERTAAVEVHRVRHPGSSSTRQAQPRACLLERCRCQRGRATGCSRRV